MIMDFVGAAILEAGSMETVNFAIGVAGFVLAIFVQTWGLIKWVDHKDQVLHKRITDLDGKKLNTTQHDREADKLSSAIKDLGQTLEKSSTQTNQRIDQLIVALATAQKNHAA
jgi:choline-glycine betaine transporter